MPLASAEHTKAVAAATALQTVAKQKKAGVSAGLSSYEE